MPVTTVHISACDSAVLLGSDSTCSSVLLIRRSQVSRWRTLAYCPQQWAWTKGESCEWLVGTWTIMIFSSTYHRPRRKNTVAVIISLSTHPFINTGLYGFQWSTSKLVQGSKWIFHVPSSPGKVFKSPPRAGHAFSMCLCTRDLRVKIIII